MYLKTIDAVRRWMLYRPMVPGNPDVLFSGLVTTAGDPETDLKLTAEVEHLTCFIGGMVGMGAKIFGLEGDLELAMKLADGCVYAYEAFPSGIMPEGSTVLPCEDAEQCTWNETAYWEFLDPMAHTRDHVLEEYIENKALRDSEKARLAEGALTKADQEKIDAYQAADIPEGTRGMDIAKQEEKAKLASALLDPTHTTEPAPTSNPISLQKRQSHLTDGALKIAARGFEEDVAQAKQDYKMDMEGALHGVSSPPSAMMPQDQMYMDKSLLTEAELRGLQAGRQAEIPLQEQHSATPGEVFPDPLRPLSHKEFVEARIKQEALPPGFVTIRGRKYILRYITLPSLEIEHT
jgi:mannosyl-oligosaccharide alpha-1,2-mannosidase